MNRNLVAFFISIFLLSAVNAWAQTYWARTFGGSATDSGSSIQTTPDGGSIIAGYSTSFSAGDNDIWVLKLDSAGNIQWQKTYGGNNDDFANFIEITPDTGFIVAGLTASFGAGGFDVWILKLDSSGNVQWQKTYGGAFGDVGSSIQTTSDGGYIIAGYTGSFGAGFQDFWIIKLDSLGNIQWQKTYGGSNVDVAYSIQTTSDGGYIAAGYTNSFGAGGTDFWVLKLDSSGNIQWQKTYGGSNGDVGRSVQTTADGGYIVAGATGSFGAGSDDFWILKLDSSGNIQWQKTYGGAGDDFAHSIQTTSDGGYVAAGRVFVFNDHFWLLKLDASGNIQWQKLYGGDAAETAFSVRTTSSGRIIVAGDTSSYGSGFRDFWILRLNSSGEIDPSCIAFDTFAVPAVSAIVPGGGAFSINEPAVTISNSMAAIADSNATMIEQCESVCVFCDDFEDGVLAQNWTYEKPEWVESAGFLRGTPTKKKAIAVASPAFTGCVNCELEASVRTAGGAFNKIWIYMHRVDKRTLTELLIKEENDKVILKQRINKTIVAKNKATVTINPNTDYVFRISFDGTQYMVFMNDTLLFAMNPGGTVPNATVGIAAKNTTVSVGHINVD